jgi:hypothetical protein
MQIIIPCDYKIVDLLKTEDANKFGEALRGLCFVGNCMDLGCYTTFEVHKCLKEIKLGKIYNEAKKVICPENTLHVYHSKLTEKECSFDEYKIIEPYEIVCAWEWDGDGCLYFRFNDRKVINTDCKCDYTWNWC